MSWAHRTFCLLRIITSQPRKQLCYGELGKSDGNGDGSGDEKTLNKPYSKTGWHDEYVPCKVPGVPASVGSNGSTVHTAESAWLSKRDVPEWLSRTKELGSETSFDIVQAIVPCIYQHGQQAFRHKIQCGRRR